MIESRVSNTSCIEMSVNDFVLRHACDQLKMVVFNDECTIIIVRTKTAQQKYVRSAHRRRKEREKKL